MLWVLCPRGCPCTAHPGGQVFRPHCHGSTLYLVSGRKAAPTLVPCDGGLGLPSDHTVQIQGLPFDHCGGRGLDPDGWGHAGHWGQRETDHTARVRYQGQCWGLCLPPAPTCPDPLPHVLSPWEEPLPWMVTMSEVSWEPAPLLT